MNDLIRKLDAAMRACNAADKAYADARKAVVAMAKRAGIMTRMVFVVGKLAWYVDPPGVAQAGAGDDGWGVSFGPPPTMVDVAEEGLEVIKT